MSPLTFFYQECPVCGRNLRIRVQYFGKEMSCSHCGGEFVASPPEHSHASCIQRELAPAESGFIAHGRFGMAQLGEV
jgi:hypothetical protein